MLLWLVFLLCIINCCYAGDLPVVCPQCDPNWTPFPNMVSAMRGYNLATGDPLHTDADPGFVNQIFAPTRYEDSTVYLDDAITASDLNNCQRSMDVHSYSNTDSMSKTLETYSTSGYNLQLGYENEITAGIPEIPIEEKTTIPPAFTRAWSQSNSMKEASSAFSSSKGMISITQGVCIQYEVVFSSFMLPQFMQAFIKGLGELYDAASLDESKQQDMFIRFINDFGTHYLIQSELGASFAQQTTYSGTVKNSMGYETLQDCNEKKGTRIFGIQVEEDSSECTESDENTLNEYTESDVKQMTITKGSRPTDINDWVTQEFTPTPLKFTLSPIVNLFQENYIEKRNLVNSNGDKIDSTIIRKWFVPLYHKYCEIMGFDCSKPSGCGYDDECPLDATCNSDSGDPHECETWSQWACVVPGKGVRQKRTRTCQGCGGDLTQERDRVCEEQDPYDKFGKCIIHKGSWGVQLKCQEGYIGTSTCGSGAGHGCGESVANMFQCCKVRGAWEQEGVCADISSSWGAPCSCVSKGDLVKEFCESCAGKECNGHANRVSCCNYKESQNLVADNNNCKWDYQGYGGAANCGDGYALAGVCGSGTGKECPGNTAHGARCCKLHTSSDVDTCIILDGNYGVQLTCPSGYIATGACGSGSGQECGAKIANRLQCCKTRVSSESSQCNSMATDEYGKNQICLKANDRIKLVNQYCGSGSGKDCSGGNVNQINCCEMSNLITNSGDCKWKQGNYGEFIQCDQGYAMSGACGSGAGHECDNNSAHGIYCCRVE